MTGLTRLTGFTICLIAAAFLSLPRHAAAVNLKAKFEGNVTCNLDDSATANTITIAASGATWTCGNYRVQGVGGAAKIIRDETSGDTIQIVNAKISRTAAAPDLHVTFYSTAAHTDPPTSGSSVDVVYRLEAQGYFKRDSTNNLATNSQFKGRGYVQTPASNPEGGTWYYLGSNPPSTSTGYELVWTVCGTAGCSNYFPGTFATPASHFTVLDAQRYLKSEFWVKLSSLSDYLMLTSAIVHDTAFGAGGQCDPESDEDCQPRCHKKECVEFKKKKKTP